MVGMELIRKDFVHNIPSNMLVGPEFPGIRGYGHQPRIGIICMRPKMRSRLAMLLLGVSVVQGFAAAGAEPRVRASVVCSIPSIWEPGSVRQVLVEREPPRLAEPQLPRPGNGRPWQVVLKGTGADRLVGREKARILGFGVLWWVRPSEIGVSEARAISVLLRAGAVIARREGDGRVYFRARREVAQAVADRAVAMLGPVQPGATAPVGSGLDHLMAAITREPEISRMKATVAMLRVEGRQSRNPVEFIENIPTGMTVLPYGTSFVVHVSSYGVNDLTRYLDEEGNKVLLVGASGEVSVARPLADPIGSCGGRALLSRFPTPKVVQASSAGVMVDVAGQTLQIMRGDGLLVVSPPAFGGGLEMAFIRFDS